MISLNSVLASCATNLLESQREVTPGEVIECARRDYASLFEIERDRLVWLAAARIVKEILRELSNDEEEAQLNLPELNLPSAIAVRGEGGDYYYVSSRKATWTELLAGREERVHNVQRAQAKLDRYNETLGRLRPLMEPHPARTVQQAAELLFGAAQ